MEVSGILERRRPWVMSTLVWAYVAVVVVLVVVALLTVPGSSGEEVVLGSVVIAYAVVGAFILQRRPGHAIGWLLLVPGLTVLGGLTAGSLTQPPTEVTVGLLVAIWFDNLSWLLLILPIFLMLALFPTGRPISPGWRWHTRAVLAMGLLLAIWGSLTRQIGPLDESWIIDNPIGFLPNPAEEVSWFMPLWTLGLVAVTIGALTSMVLRFRRADPVERDQIKWLLYAVTLFAAVYVPFAFFQFDSAWFGAAFMFSLAFIPVAMAIAILRYRVFDIDVVIRRTVAFAIVAVLLTAAYVVSIVVLQSLVGRIVRLDSAVGVAGSTLVVVVLFSPVRRRVQRMVNRRFFRPPYDTDAIVSRFGATVRDETDPVRLEAELLEIVAATMHPRTIALWMSAPSDTPDGQGAG